MPVFTAAAAYIATSIGVTSALGVAVINFGVRVLATYAISSLITRQPELPGGSSSTPTGNRVQVPPATNNKLPVIYGNAFMSGAIVDAKISTNQQYMWYVLAITEVTDTGTITFDDPNNAGFPLAYWGDKQMQFDSTDRTKVIGLIDPSSSAVDTSVDGSMNVYFYNDGSASTLYGAPNAITLLSDSSTGGGIPVDQRWNNDNDMTKCAFMVIRIKYNQDANLTGLQQVTAYVRNSLYQPGSVLIDYLTNTRYGCAVPLTMIDVGAFTGINGLNAYSAETITYTGGSQARYKINGPVMTSQSCMSNLLQLCEACDSWLQWNEQLGQWSIVVNRPYDWNGITATEDLFTIYSDTIIADANVYTPANYYGYVIGGVDITPVDLNNTYNKIEVQFPNELIKDQTDYAYMDLAVLNPSLLNPNEPVNSLVMQLPQVNDSVQAQYLGNRKLEQARDDLIVSMTVDYSAIQVDAGDVVRVYHEMYGWTDQLGFPDGKLFRVTQVQETKDEEGNLGCRLTMMEYNDQVYDDFTISAFTPAQNTGITDPTIISTPNAPTISNINTTATVPSYVVNVTAPTLSVGQVTSLEFWYAISTTPPGDTSTFKLYETQYYNAGPVYPKNYTESITVSGLPASGAGFNYYWRVRAVGNRSKSGFSNNSTGFSWSPNPATTVTGQNFQVIFQPNPVTVNRFSNNTPDIANVAFSLYGVSGPGQVDFANVSTNAAMANNTWRIDTANIIAGNITVSSPTDGGNYAYWGPGSVTGLTANVASYTVPVFYKDATGNMFTPPGASVNINTLQLGQTGQRGIITLAYVPVNYNPTYGNVQATDANLTNSFFSTTGYTPIDKDGAVFYNETLDISSSRVYDGNATPYKWTSAVLQVPGSTITANSIIGNQIKANTITGNKITSNTITSNNITANTITANNIAANTITGNKIAANTITSNNIAANTITADKLSANFTYTGNIASFNANIGNSNSDGFWFDGPNGTARIGNSLSVGLLIESSQLRANTVTAENLVIGSVTQSRSTQSDPKIALMPFYNWPSGTVDPAWPNFTRGIIPPSGVTIVPTTDPTSSANVEYTEGSRIQVGITAKVWCNPAQANYNLIEIWKSGGTSYYNRGFNHVRHSYDLTSGSTASQTIHAYGFGGIDLYSTDGGVTWSTYNGTTADRTITGAISFYYNVGFSSTGLGTQVVGPLQVSSFGGGIPTSNWGSRNTTTPNPPTSLPINFYYTTFVPAEGQYNYTSWQDMCVAPYTGGNGRWSGNSATSSQAIVCGYQGTIFSALASGTGPAGIIAPYNTWRRENTGGTLQTLNAVYAGRHRLSPTNDYTAVSVGDTGTILVSDRVWDANTYNWFGRTCLRIGTSEQLLTDLYDVASDDTSFSTTTKWVAVGQYGTIIYSLNNGGDWTQADTSTIPQNLHCVRYGNGKWVAAGDDGVILTSTDAINWTQIQSTLTTDDLLTIDYSLVHNRFNIGGTTGIYSSNAGTLNFVKASGSSISSVAAFNLTRIAYWGSNPNINDNTEPPPEQRLINGQTLSATIIDTQYSEGVPVTYYLVVGNMASGYKDVYIGQMFINATEVKR